MVRDSQRCFYHLRLRLLPLRPADLPQGITRSIAEPVRVADAQSAGLWKDPCWALGGCQPSLLPSQREQAERVPTAFKALYDHQDFLPLHQSSSDRHEPRPQEGDIRSSCPLTG